MWFCQQLTHTVPSEELEKGTLFLWVDAASGQNLSLAKWSVAWISVAACPLGQPPLYAEQPEQLYKWALCLRPSIGEFLLPRSPWLDVFPMSHVCFPGPFSYPLVLFAASRFKFVNSPQNGTSQEWQAFWGWQKRVDGWDFWELTTHSNVIWCELSANDFCGLGFLWKYSGG